MNFNVWSMGRGRKTGLFIRSARANANLQLEVIFELYTLPLQAWAPLGRGSSQSAWGLTYLPRADGLAISEEGAKTQFLKSPTDDHVTFVIL
jgi:hypothetical protein